jgi:hypothetical protein
LTQYGPGFGKVVRKINQDPSQSDSPRNNLIAELQRQYGSLSNLRAGDGDLFEVLKNQSLIGVYEADPRAQMAGAERSPDINRINHFLPDSIKGAYTAAGAQQQRNAANTVNGNMFKPSPTNMSTVGGTAHDMHKTRNHTHTASMAQM